MITLAWHFYGGNTDWETAKIAGELNCNFVVLTEVWEELNTEW